MYFDKSKNRWIAQVYLTKENGKIYRKTKHFRRKRDASEWQTIHRKEIQLADSLSKPIPEDGADLRVVELANYFWKHRTQLGISKKTCDDTLRSFKRMFLTTAVKKEDHVCHVTRATAIRIVEELKTICPGNGSAVDACVKTFKAAWNWAILTYNLQCKNPFSKLESAKKAASIPHYMPPMEDFMKVASIAPSSYKAVLFFSLFACGRKIEGDRLQISDIDFAHNRIGLRTRKRKGGIEQIDYIYMNEELAAALKKHIKTSDCTERVFEGMQLQTGSHMRWLETLCKDVGVKKFGLHGLRSLAASTALAKGATIYDVQAMLRHQSLQVTDRYIRRICSSPTAPQILGKVFHEIKKQSTDKLLTINEAPSNQSQTNWGSAA